MLILYITRWILVTFRSGSHPAPTVRHQAMFPIVDSGRLALSGGRRSRCRRFFSRKPGDAELKRFLVEIYEQIGISSDSDVKIRDIVEGFKSKANNHGRKFRLWAQKVTVNVGKTAVGMIFIHVSRRRCRLQIKETVENFLHLLRDWQRQYAPAV